MTIFTTDLTNLTDRIPWTPWTFELGSKTKTRKTPCVGCKMSLTSHWCCACLKILKQAWIFSVSYIITLQGLCIHRKAINKNKPLSSGWYPTTDCTPQALWCLEGNHITSTPHALRCLEGTTMSNRGQRPRIHDTPPNICLEGSTPQDGKVYSCLSPWRGWWPSEGRWWYAFGLGVKSSLL